MPIRMLTARSAALAVAVLTVSLLAMPTGPLAAAPAIPTQSTGPCGAPAGPVELTSVPQVEGLLAGSTASTRPRTAPSYEPKAPTRKAQPPCSTPHR